MAMRRGPAESCGITRPGVSVIVISTRREGTSVVQERYLRSLKLITMIGRLLWVTDKSCSLIKLSGIAKMY